VRPPSAATSNRGRTGGPARDAGADRHRQRRGGGRKPMAWQLLFDDVLFALRLPAAVLSPRLPA
jgi:hypothetical protein